MQINVYQLTGSVSRSVLRAKLVNTVETEQFPRDQRQFARDHGGDFIEILEEEAVAA